MKRRAFISMLLGAAGAPLVPWREIVDPVIFLPTRRAFDEFIFLPYHDEMLRTVADAFGLPLRYLNGESLKTASPSDIATIGRFNDRLLADTLRSIQPLTIAI